MNQTTKPRAPERRCSCGKHDLPPRCGVREFTRGRPFHLPTACGSISDPAFLAEFMRWRWGLGAPVDEKEDRHG